MCVHSVYLSGAEEGLSSMSCGGRKGVSIAGCWLLPLSPATVLRHPGPPFQIPSSPWVKILQWPFLRPWE